MTSRGFTIKSVDRTLLHIPFHERCARVKEIRVPGWGIVELCKVTTSSGVTGVGETIVNYTWGKVSDQAIGQVVGHSVLDFLWDDSLGAGLQMALHDAAGKLTGVPCHKLIGTRYRDACPVSWWAQDMKPEEWAAEAKSAEEHGFTTMKVKARPWFDPMEQMAAVSAAVSPHFKMDMDFNGLLLGVDIAVPLLTRLEQTCENLAIFESPIPQTDVAGNALLRRKISNPIAMHFGSPPVMTAIREGVCDGFVISGGVNRVVHEGILAEKAAMPFWLQLVGTGLTAMFSVHLGSVLELARWPAIPCINVFEHPLIRDFHIEGGHVVVPEGPGLGVDIDQDALERYRVDSDFELSARRQIHTIQWPDGRSTHYPDGGYREDFLAGKLIGWLPGITLDRELDDGSDEFDRRYRELFPDGE